MAATAEDFLYGEDLDAILEAIDEDILQNNTEFEVELTSVSDEIPKEKAKVTFTCSLCSKVCVSQGGYLAHNNTKHSKEKESDASLEAEQVLHPLYFKRYIEDSIIKLTGDECYPSEITNEFKFFKIGS